MVSSVSVSASWGGEPTGAVTRVSLLPGGAWTRRSLRRDSQGVWPKGGSRTSATATLGHVLHLVKNPEAIFSPLTSPARTAETFPLQSQRPRPRATQKSVAPVAPRAYAHVVWGKNTGGKPSNRASRRIRTTAPVGRGQAGRRHSRNGTERRRCVCPALYGAVLRRQAGIHLRRESPRATGAPRRCILTAGEAGIPLARPD